jgi:membrane dipeptidase
MTGVAHFKNNDFGDSATDPGGPEFHGLSPLGRRLVQEANRLGIILDASHSSDDVFDQMLELSTTPIILSHSGCKAIYDHPRNLDDERLRRLAAKGGVIQINAYGDYLAAAEPNPERDAALRALYERTGERQMLSAAQVAAMVRERAAILARYPGSQRSFDQFMAHLLHALRLIGPDHVGIGLDWDGGGGVAGMEDVSRIPRITQALLDAGYSEADLAKIWGGNVLRLLRAAEAAARVPSAPPPSHPL